MRRVIYCPTERDIEESILLAQTACLPINIGEFEESIDLEFDRDIVQVLTIPEIKNVEYLEEVQNGFHQKINYLNDFISFKKNCHIIINNKKYIPILVEEHRLKFIIKEDQSGIKNAEIINNEITIEEFEYNVY